MWVILVSTVVEAVEVVPAVKALGHAQPYASSFKIKNGELGGNTFGVSGYPPYLSLGIAESAHQMMTVLLGLL